MEDQTLSDAERLLQQAGITMHFEEVSAHSEPYLDGTGLRNTYQVTFTRAADQKQAQVIALIDNMHPRPIRDFQILSTLSVQIEALWGATTFEEWCVACVTNDATSYDARQIVGGRQEYLRKRYHFLSQTATALQSIFPGESYIILTEFFFRSVSNYWPW